MSGGSSAAVGDNKLLERAEQLAALSASLAAVAESGQGRIVLVPGEAGIGKTALLRRFSACLDSSVRVLSAGCDPLFTPRPLGLALDLAELVGGAVAERAADATRPYDVAAALLRELKGKTSVLFLEDLHWADEATLDVVGVVGRRIATVPLLLVLTYREDGLDRTHPLRMVLGSLPGSEFVTRLVLPGLSQRAIARLAGGAAGIGARELHRWTSGNPFFVTEVLAADAARVPHTVRDAVLARAASLSGPARDLLDAIAVVPGRAELRLLRALVPAGADALDQCLASGMALLAEDCLEFRHEIERQVIEESLPPGRRNTLHRAALAALASQEHPDIARLVHHAEAAGDDAAMRRYAPAAAERAAAAGARHEAAQLYARALRFAAELPEPERANLLERFAAEAYFTAMGEQATEALREAAEIYQRRGDLVGQARAMRQLGRQLGLDGQLAESRATLLAAVDLLRQLPAGPELARTYAVLSANFGITDNAEAIRWGTRAIKLAERVGCPDALIYALNNVGTIELREGDHGGLRKLERSRDMAAQSGDTAGVGRAYLHLALALTARREWPLLERFLEPGISYCRDQGLEAWQAWMTMLRAESALAHGHWEEVSDMTSRALRTMPAGFSHARCTALVLQARLQARLGEPGYWPLLDEAARNAKAVSIPFTLLLIACARAEAAWLDGGPPESIVRETDSIPQGPSGAGIAWFPGELDIWRSRAGLPCDDPAKLAEPYRLEISGDYAGAARWWEDRGCGYQAALALAGGDTAAQRRALDMLLQLGARGAASAVSRRLQALGERGLPRGPRPTTTANPAGLSNRETEVLRLLAAGLSNAQIAARLVVSARTIDHHVSAILRKLGVHTRAEATVLAAQLEIADATRSCASTT